MAKIKLNRGGVRQLLRSEEMQQICNDFAFEAKAKLGDGYDVTYRRGKNRVNASIGAVGADAIRENKRDNSIIKALK